MPKIENRGRLMIQGMKYIISHLTMGDEYGVYRVTPEKYRYLLFVCTRRTEAIERGKAVAKVLGVKFQNWIPTITDDQQKKEDLDVDPKSATLLSVAENEPVQETRTFVKKKVMGVTQRCKECLAKGMKDDEIVEDILPRYLEVGRERTESEAAIRSLLFYAKKG